jgi:hypothetical protein
MKRKLQSSQIQTPLQIGFYGLSKEFENLLLSFQKCQKINEDIFVSNFLIVLDFYISKKHKLYIITIQSCQETSINYRF